MALNRRRFSCLLLSAVCVIWTLHLSHATFTLGYLTGSQRLPSDEIYNRPGLSISGALTLALDEINSRQDILPNDTLQFVIGETFGKSAESLKNTALFWQRNISAIIGPQETCVCEAKLAGSFGIPMISYFCPETAVTDKQRYPTFSRTRAPDFQVSKSVAGVLKYFQWTNVVVLSHARERFDAIVKNTIQILEASNIRVAAHRNWSGTYYHGFTENPFIKLVDETYTQTRIYVVIGSPHEYIGLLLCMEKKGLFNDGQYFVIGVHNDQYDEERPEKYIKGVFQSETNQLNLRLRAYRSYLGIIGSPPVNPEYAKFEAKVQEYLELPPFRQLNLAVASGLDTRIQVRPEAAYLYDAVYLYAWAVHMALENNDNPLDGKVLMKHICGTSYKSAMGYHVHIDENGDAQGNYTLIALKPLDSASHYGLVPVGVFEHVEPGEDEENMLGIPVLQLRRSIDWRGGVVPAAVPQCGFNGELCVDENVIGNHGSF